MLSAPSRSYLRGRAGDGLTQIIAVRRDVRRRGPQFRIGIGSKLEIPAGVSTFQHSGGIGGSPGKAASSHGRYARTRGVDKGSSGGGHEPIVLPCATFVRLPSPPWPRCL